MMRRGVVAWISFLLVSSVYGGSLLMDPTGTLKVNNIPSSLSTDSGVVSLIYSPGTTSFFSTASEIMSLESSDPILLSCRGATTSGTPTAERNCLATTSLVSGAILLDGVTEGDIESGFRNSRHARTLTALFRAKVSLSSQFKQSLLIVVKGDVDADKEQTLRNDARSLFEATVAEVGGKASFSDLYDLKVLSVTSSEEATKALETAQECALNAEGDEKALSEALQSALSEVRDSGIGQLALDPPNMAQAFVSIGSVYMKQARIARAKISAWKSRVSRGLWVDGFGAAAEALRKRCLGGFDSETLGAAGLPIVAEYRLEMRNKLEELVDDSIRSMFIAQVANLEKSTLKKLRAELLRKLEAPAENAMNDNAAALRAASFSFDSIAEDLQVPSLSLTKVQPCREMEAKLTEELVAFPDSPMAKLKRMKKVSQVARKEKKKPGQRAIDIGLDLVAVLRPDGFGTFQGFAGYQIGGHMITFGVSNDADDPQVISQFGGVRPPLLRIQPKLRVDVEM